MKRMRKAYRDPGEEDPISEGDGSKDECERSTTNWAMAEPPPQPCKELPSRDKQKAIGPKAIRVLAVLLWNGLAHALRASVSCDL